MKYIISFNESAIADNCKKFRDESAGLLSYLLDDENIGFYVSYMNKSNRVKVEISTKSRYSIEWKDYKDDIIQYIEYVNKKYPIYLIKFTSLSSRDSYSVSKSLVLPELEDIGDDFDFFEMEFNIRF